MKRGSDFVIDKKKQDGNNDGNDDDGNDDDGDGGLLDKDGSSVNQKASKNIREDTTTFKWKMKDKKLKEIGIKIHKPTLEEERERKAKVDAELESVRLAREERERLREEHRQEKSKEARMKDAEMFEQWGQKEEIFHLQTLKLRAFQRLKEGRAKPIDYCISYVNPEDSQKSSSFFAPPFNMLPNVVKYEDYYKEMADDLKNQIKLDSANKSFWEAMLFLLIDYYNKNNNNNDNNNNNNNNNNNDLSMNKKVMEQVEQLLVNKSYSELTEMEKQVSKNINSGNTMNVEYWELLMKRLLVFKALAYLSNFDTTMKEKYASAAALGENGTVEGEGTVTLGGSGVLGDADATDEDILSKIASGISKSNNNNNKDDNGGNDAKYLTLMNAAAAGGGGDNDDEEDSADAGDLEVFKLEELALPENQNQKKKNNNNVDKYQTRKPYFISKSKSRYDWNNYTKAHYSKQDNAPPPKVIYGYEFTVFYTELINKSVPPTYFVEKIPTCTDNSMIRIRFHAGAPYEDIAFAIINKPWNKSTRFGYRSYVDAKGILHLRFNFRTNPWAK